MTHIQKFEIHPFCYIVALIYIITGMFRPFFWITTLIIMHEMGHVLAGLLFKWNIEKVTIMPVGGITIFKESLNRPIFEELIIAIMGPIFQIIFYLFIKDYVNYSWFYSANLALLIFNLVPVIPLDGSKILHCITDMLFSYKKSHKIILWISIFVLCIGGIICYWMNNLIIYIMFICIALKVIEEYKTSSLRFQKFLLERYLNNYYFNKTKKLYKGKTTEMYRDYNHIFFMNNHWISERKFLKSHFER